MELHRILLGVILMFFHHIRDASDLGIDRLVLL